MLLQLSTGPAAEPLTLAEAKAQLIISESAESADDTLIESLIATARRKVEQDTGLQLIIATYYGLLDSFPCGRGELRIPIWPIQSVGTISYFFAAGEEKGILAASDDYQLDPFSRPSRLVPNPGESWPSTESGRINAVSINEIVAGYGEAGSDVPEDLIHAMKLVLTHLYEHRGDDDAPEFRSSAYESLIGPYKSMEYR